jgi:signal transduction histidine kinase
LFHSPFYGARTDQLELAQDMTLMPTIQKAMSQVLEKGHPALATLDGKKGVVVLAAVYTSDQQATRQQRSENLAGFVMAVVDMAAVIEVGLQRANLYDAVTQQTLADVSETGAGVTLYAHDHHGQPRDVTAMREDTNLLVKDTAITTGGAQWRLRFASPYAAYGKAVPWSAWIVLIVGLLITGVISAFAASLTHSARVEKIVHKRTAELKDAHEKVRESEMMLIQAEKLSSLGEMVAGVAHEINTPLGFIRCNLEMMDEQLLEMQMACSENIAEKPDGSSDVLMDFNMKMDDFASMVSETTQGIDRINEIVVSLKDFSRMDRLNFDEVDLHRCIDSTLNIAHNKIKHVAKVVKDYGQLPLVSCASGQINQVLLNIIINASQAIDGFGEISISTRSQGDKVSIAIQDNGKGMSEATKQKVFQPFFTTKDVGKGTGLGLSICDKIIRQHNGEILIDSTEGMGTTFTIILPVRHTLAKAA